MARYEYRADENLKGRELEEGYISRTATQKEARVSIYNGAQNLAARMGFGKDTTKAKQIAQSWANRVEWIVRYIWIYRR
jgi:osmotically-inducible protein OsmY